MGDDLKASIEALTRNVALMQKSIEANAKAIANLTISSSSTAGARPGPGGEHHQDRPAKHWRPEFPRYDGKSDPLVFLNQCESFFTQQRIMPEERTWMASYNLQEAAQLWYMQVQADEGTPPWPRFKEILNLRFGPPLRAAPLFELASCRRTGTVEEYQDRFQALLPRAGHLDETQRVQLFTGGLLPPLSLQVQNQNPQTLAAAMSLARQMELLEQYYASTPKAPARGVLSPPAPRPHPQPVTKPGAPTASVEGRPIKRLNQAEQEERRRLGLCFNCDEKYSRGHNKVCKRLFFVDSVAEDDDDAAEDTPNTEAPVFSLHAVAGVTVGTPILLRVTIGATTLVALVDTGSTHNFIGEAAAHRTGLPIQPRPRLTATVANGEKVACPGVLRQASILIEGMAFDIDLYVMPLAGYDMVLGTQWMATLGRIAWDVATHTLSFQRDGRDACWSGVVTPDAPTAHAVTSDGSLLDGLLDSFTDLFSEPQGLPPPRSRDHHIVLHPGCTSAPSSPCYVITSSSSSVPSARSASHQSRTWGTSSPPQGWPWTPPRSKQSTTGHSPARRVRCAGS